MRPSYPEDVENLRRDICGDSDSSESEDIPTNVDSDMTEKRESTSEKVLPGTSTVDHTSSMPLAIATASQISPVATSDVVIRTGADRVCYFVSI